MEPLVAAVWSCDPEVALDYPARYLFTFLEHHGMLGVFGSPQWRTVTGGSQRYVAAVAARLQEVRTGVKVTSVLETADGVEVTDGNGQVQLFDAVVIATHPGQALTMLAEPTTDAARRAHRDALLAQRRPPAHRHVGAALLAARPGVLELPPPPRRAGVVTYDLTRLQRLDTETRYLVTLGGEGSVDPAKVIDRMEYEHPLYDPGSVAAQAQLPGIDSDRISFAGAYHGWGFHEDGARSGLAGGDPARPRLAGGAASLARRRRRDRRLRDDDPAHPAYAVQAQLHAPFPPLGGRPRRPARPRRAGAVRGPRPPRPMTSPAVSIRANVDAFLASHDIDLAGGRVVMAANARAFGHCFNPISVHWCWDANGRHAATVVEVHNTYGDRHAYLVHPDEQGRATTPKAMYVSPFHGTDGRYDLVVPVPHDDRLDVVVNLTTVDGATFHASLAGHRTATTPRRAAPAAIRGAALIRMHGIWLWLRRLPVQPRPTHTQKGVQHPPHETAR